MRETTPIEATPGEAIALVDGKKPLDADWQQREALWETTVRLARVADRGTVLDTILTAMEGMGLVGPHVLLSDRRTGALELAAHRGVPWQLASRMGEPIDPTLAPFVAMEGVIPPGEKALGPLVSVALADGLQHQAAALYGDGRVVGVLGWISGRGDDGMPCGMEQMAQVFAAALLRVLRGARQRKRSSQRDAVRRAALVVGEARDLPSMLRAICDRVKLLTGAELVAVRNCGELGNEAGWVASKKFEQAATLAPERWPHSVPIRHQGRKLAEIRLLPGEASERPTDDDLRLTALLAEHVAALVEAANAKSQLLREVAERRRTESWLSTVVEHSPVATLLLSHSPEGPVASCNRRAKELLSLEAEGPISRIFPSLYRTCGSSFPTEENPLRRVLEGERIQTLEALVYKLDEAPTPVLVHGEPIGGAEGTTSGAVVVLENISAFKTLEQLRAQWTSLVTHDLRQPVTSILGFATILSQHPDLPDAIAGKVSHILSAARRPGRLSSDLLDASRMEAKELALEKAQVDVCSLARGLADELSRAGAGQPIQVITGDEAPIAELDPIRLEQILENLLSNARKYGREEAPITLRIEEAQGEVLLHVENEGEGLDPDDLNKIFTRFYRGKGASKKPGMGLGLYISKGLVEAHGGRIWATSIKGKTVVFSVALPLG